MRKYETIFIINPDLSDEDTRGLIERVRGIIQTLQGEILRIQEWGRKKLAYEVNKMSKGYFVLLHFIGTPSMLTELERNLRLMDAVLKYQTVRLDEKGERIAQMLSGEKAVGKGEKPESQTEKTLERSPQEEDTGKDVTHEKLPEATPATEEPGHDRGEGTDS